MKKLFLSLAFAGIVFSSNAQDLPVPSPKSKLEQRVGLTDITIDYSRPSAKGRLVFPEVVPPNTLWRTGANMNTTIEVSTDIIIEGKALPAGKYSLFTVPNDDMWQVIFNRKTDHSGTSGYDANNNELLVEIKPSRLSDEVETFTIDINDISTNSANLILAWQNTRIAIPFEMDVMAMAENNIEKAFETTEGVDVWKVYRNAANYYHNNNMEAEKALEYIDKSINLKSDSWYSYWLKAEILADKEYYKEAIKTAKESKKIGENKAKEAGTSFDYSGMIDSGISEWKAKK